MNSELHLQKNVNADQFDGLLKLGAHFSRVMLVLLDRCVHTKLIKRAFHLNGYMHTQTHSHYKFNRNVNRLSGFALTTYEYLITADDADLMSWPV